MSTCDPSVRGYPGDGWSVVTRGLVCDPIVADPAETLVEPPAIPEELHWARAPGFPFEFTADGDLRIAEDERAVLENIEVTLMTALGEWYRFPDAGSKVVQMLFEPADEVTRHLLDFHVREALAAAEPRARFRRVNVTITDDQTLQLLIPYVLNATGQVRSAEVSLPLTGV